METLTLHRPIDFSPLEKLAKKGARAPKNLGVIVVPTGNSKTPFRGLVTADNKPVVRTSLTRAEAPAFAGQALVRINELMPDRHQQVMVEIDLVATGIIVPTPPKPPKDEIIAAIAARVFEYQRHLLQEYEAQRRGKSAPAKAVVQKAVAAKGAVKTMARPKNTVR